MSQSKSKQNKETNEVVNLLPEFERSLPMSLLRARESVMKTFIPTLKAHSLSPQQWRVIRSLEQEDGLEISEISKRCYLLAPSMSRIVQNLESRGLIERRIVEEDQRRSSLHITTKGKQLFKQVAPKSAERYAYIVDNFGHEKLDALYELLEELVSSLDGDIER